MTAKFIEITDLDGEVALINIANIVVVVEDDNTPYTMLTFNIASS